MGGERREEDYNRDAKPGCKSCDGKGMLTYYWSHDDAKIAPCPQCFPEDRWATGTAQRFSDYATRDDY